MKKIFNNNKLFYFKFYLERVLLLLIGLLICAFFIFWRIFKERLPHEIDFSWDIYKFLLYLILFLLFVYLFLKKQYIIEESKNEKIIWVKEKFLKKIITIYEEALYQVFHLFYFNLHLENILIKPLAKIILKIFGSDFMKEGIYHLYIYLLLDYIPRLIVVLSLVIDVISYHEYYFFYKCIWLILIPFTCRIIYYILNEFYKQAWGMTMNYFEVKIIIPENSNEDINIWIKRRESPFFKDKISEEDYKELEEGLGFIFELRYRFLNYFGSEGIIAQSDLCCDLISIRYILYILVWEYLMLRVFFNY